MLSSDFFYGASASSGGTGSIDNGYVAANCVDGDDSYGDACVIAGPPDSTSYIQLDLGTDFIINAVRIVQQEPVQWANLCYLEGSMSPTGPYDPLATLTPPAVGHYIHHFNNTLNSYRYFRLRLGTLVGGNNGFWRVNTLQGFYSVGDADVAVFTASSGGRALGGDDNYAVVADPGGVGTSTTVTLYVQNLGDTDITSGAYVYPDEPSFFSGSGEEQFWRNMIWREVIQGAETSVNGGTYRYRSQHLPTLVAGGSRSQVAFKYTKHFDYVGGPSAYPNFFPSALAVKVAVGADVLLFEGFDQLDPTETFNTTNFCMAGRPNDIWTHDSTVDVFAFATGKPRGGLEYHCASVDQGVDYFLDNLAQLGFGYAPDSLIMGGLLRGGTGSTFTAEHTTFMAMNIQHQFHLSGSDMPLAIIMGTGGDLILKIWNTVGGGPRMVTLHTLSGAFASAEAERYIEFGCRTHGTWDLDWIVAIDGIVQASGTYNIPTHDAGHQMICINLIGYGQYGVADDRIFPFTGIIDVWVDNFYAAQAGSDDLTECIIGPTDMLMAYPIGDGITHWPTKNPGGGGGYYTYLDESPCDYDTTYLSAASFTSTPVKSRSLHSGFPSGDVVAVMVVPFTKKVGSGSADFITSLGYWDGSDRGLSQNTFIGGEFYYTTPGAILTFNPWRMRSWELDDVNTMQIGAMVDNPFGSSSATTWRLSQSAIQVMIKLTPAVVASRLMFGSISG